MILVFLFLGLIVFLILGIFFSKISIDICDFKLNNRLEKVNAKFLINLKLSLFGVIPIIIIKLNEYGISIFGIKISYEKIFTNEKIKKLFRSGIKKAKNNFKISSIKLLKPNLEKINLKLSLGTESFLMTTILVFLISTFLSFGIKNTIQKFDEDKYKYIIKPDFEEKNKIFLEMKGIFNIKTTNIIECVKLNNL